MSSERPKRPMSGYLLWLNNSRQKIKAENPGIKVTEVIRKGAEMWRSMNNEEKSIWNEKAVKAKEQYTKALKEYQKCKKKQLYSGQERYMAIQNTGHGIKRKHDDDSLAIISVKCSGSDSDEEKQYLDMNQVFFNYKPVRPMSGYMMWMKQIREKIKAENPGITITQIARKCGEIWRAMSSEEKQIWKEKSARANEQYNKVKKSFEEYERIHSNY